MYIQIPDYTHSLNIPHLDSLVIAAGHNLPIVCGPTEVSHLIGVPREHFDLTAVNPTSPLVAEWPYDLDVLVLHGDCQQTVAVVPLETLDAVAEAVQRPQTRKRARGPDVHERVLPARRQLLPVLALGQAEHEAAVFAQFALDLA